DEPDSPRELEPEQEVLALERVVEEDEVVGVLNLDRLLLDVMDTVVQEEMRVGPAVLARFRDVASLVEVEAVLSAVTDVVVLDVIVAAPDAEPDSRIGVREDQVVADEGARGGEEGDAAVSVQERLVALDDTVIAGAMQHDPVLVILPRDVVADDEVIAPLRGDDAMIAVVVDEVVLDQEVIRVIVGIEAVAGVVIALVVDPLAAVVAEGVHPVIVVMQAAVPDVPVDLDEIEDV